jgi:hypothetical protein
MWPALFERFPFFRVIGFSREIFARRSKGRILTRNLKTACEFVKRISSQKVQMVVKECQMNFEAADEILARAMIMPWPST